MRAKSILATAGLVLALSTSFAQADTLSSTELKKLAPGSYNVNVMGLVSMVITLYPNGRVSGLAKGEKDQGTWQVKGEQMCIGFSKWLGGSMHCSPLDNQGNKLKGNGLTIQHI
jgi:hypothetical protein